LDEAANIVIDPSPRIPCRAGTRETQYKHPAPAMSDAQTKLNSEEGGGGQYGQAIRFKAVQ
jgi:hypothetical protein